MFRLVVMGDITNSKSSSYIEQIGLGTIPRYVLLDQEGQVVLRNAPSPDQKLLHDEIDRLLKKNKKRGLVY